MQLSSLSNEDNLRLNVLLAQNLKAIRINEGTMTVHALTDQGEAKVVLNPNTRDEQYLRTVRELLSLKITGSPGGYPIFIKRWTRMGHTDNTLEHMLLLGEPEAVVAVVHAQTLSHDIGVRAWWAHPTTEVAMRLMEYPEIWQGELGKELVEYLMEFLPFEEKQLNIVSMVRLCLQGDILSKAEKEKLWARAKRRNPFYVGFLHSDPKQIPLAKEPSPHFTSIADKLETLIDNNNIYASTLLELLDSNGQTWLETLKLSLNKPVDQEVVISLFIAINQYFKLPLDTLLKDGRGTRSIEIAVQHSDEICEHPIDADLKAVINALDSKHLPLLNAMLVLAQMGEHTLIPVFSGNDSVGTVMRKRLLPLTTPLLEKIDILM
ncbi:hypothetical protein OO007_08725 [Cocleimonas sp. KMM 6892]|uniref:hypothetical protein n=1 Tax=unclassified Cocleimonas TaxID=2639732 RepID=UPI002DB6276B|nr:MULTISPECIES: hypothetical protein [unclassified Cocleimonas]MEB8432311.1 hypothetical protein [Cocleimonas sp. KMM 6892]MEC4714603.1 hypothetical protein [Cocleimonas sp. KMM 6895]MEC4744583.1 hypothetical protein [Cocleimonas sp. KMM 6896]